MGEKLTPLNTVHLFGKALLIHLTLLDLLMLDLFTVFLEITLFLGSFGLLDTLTTRYQQVLLVGQEWDLRFFN